MNGVRAAIRRHDVLCGDSHTHCVSLTGRSLQMPQPDMSTVRSGCQALCDVAHYGARWSSRTAALSEPKAAGASRPRCRRTSSSMRSSKRSTTAAAATWCITATAARSTCRCATPNGWRTPASSPPSAAAATRTTTPWPSPSWASSRRRSFGGAARAPSRFTDQSWWRRRESLLTRFLKIACF